jgi:hypothetical protein
MLFGHCIGKKYKIEVAKLKKLPKSLKAKIGNEYVVKESKKPLKRRLT